MSDLLELAAKIVNTRGYLVIGSLVPQKIGTVDNPHHNGEFLNQPCRIVRETTRADFQAQCTFLGEGAVWDGWGYFYVIETD